MKRVLSFLLIFLVSVSFLGCEKGEVDIKGDLNEIEESKTVHFKGYWENQEKRTSTVESVLSIIEDTKTASGESYGDLLFSFVEDVNDCFPSYKDPLYGVFYMINECDLGDSFSKYDLLVYYGVGVGFKENVRVTFLVSQQDREFIIFQIEDGENKYDAVEQSQEYMRNYFESLFNGYRRTYSPSERKAIEEGRERLEQFLVYEGITEGSYDSIMFNGIREISGEPFYDYIIYEKSVKMAYDNKNDRYYADGLNKYHIYIELTEPFRIYIGADAPGGSDAIEIKSINGEPITENEYIKSGWKEAIEGLDVQSQYTKIYEARFGMDYDYWRDIGELQPDCQKMIYLDGQIDFFQFKEENGKEYVYVKKTDLGNDSEDWIWVELIEGQFDFR